MKLARYIGATNQSVIVFLEDSTSANAAGKTGVAHTGVTAYFSRVETDNDVTVAAISLSALANITAAHADGGWVEVDGTNMPGYYRLDLPDAVFADGATETQVCLKPATGTAWKQVNVEIQLMDAVYQAKVVLSKGTTDDVYAIQWYRNGVALITGVTDPTLAFQDDDDAHVGSNLVGVADQNESGLCIYTESPGTIAEGHTRACYVSATIDGGTRTGVWNVFRPATGV